VLRVDKERLLRKDFQLDTSGNKKAWKTKINSTQNHHQRKCKYQCKHTWLTRTGKSSSVSERQDICPMRRKRLGRAIQILNLKLNNTILMDLALVGVNSRKYLFETVQKKKRIACISFIIYIFFRKAVFLGISNHTKICQQDIRSRIKCEFWDSFA
jgi:hypothetical protein